MIAAYLFDQKKENLSVTPAWRYLYHQFAILKNILLIKRMYKIRLNQFMRMTLFQDPCGSVPGRKGGRIKIYTLNPLGFLGNALL